MRQSIVFGRPPLRLEGLYGVKRAVREIQFPEAKAPQNSQAVRSGGRGLWGCRQGNRDGLIVPPSPAKVQPAGLSGESGVFALPRRGTLVDVGRSERLAGAELPEVPEMELAGFLGHVEGEIGDGRSR